MKNNTRLISLLSLIVLLVACVEIEDVRLTESRLSINCLFYPDNNWSVSIRKVGLKGPIKDLGVHILDEADNVIPLSWNNQDEVYEVLFLNPKVGEKYSLELIKDGEKKIVAKSWIPNLAEIANLTAVLCGEEICLSFDLNTSSGIPYYLFRIKQNIQGQLHVYTINRGSSLFESMEVIPQSRVSYAVFRNIGYAPSIRLFLVIPSNRIALNEPLLLYAETCSSEIGKYWNSLQQYDLNLSSTVYSNIVENLGVFGGYNISTHSVRIIDK